MTENNFEIQDKYVREAITTDNLLTKEQILRKKIIESQDKIPKLREFPYLIDAEYLCFEKSDQKYRIRPGQGDLFFTNGNNEYVAVEIKSSYVCFNGSDRVQAAKTTKLIEQIHYYQDYQKGQMGPDARVHGCGIKEQKIYWIDHDGNLTQYWWTHGPDVPPVQDNCIIDFDSLASFEDTMDIEELPEDYQELHAMYVDETISRHYPHLQFYGNGKMVYISKCKNKRITVCKEHVAQHEIDEIKQRDRQDGFRHGQIMMFGEVRPTLFSF